MVVKKELLKDYVWEKINTDKTNFMDQVAKNRQNIHLWKKGEFDLNRKCVKRFLKYDKDIIAICVEFGKSAKPKVYVEREYKE